jgi:hypothetical protein
VSQRCETLRERAEHVARNRRRFVRDMTEEAAADYRRLVDELEAKRGQVLELRATEVWAGMFPSEFLANEPQTGAIVGAKRRWCDTFLA